MNLLALPLEREQIYSIKRRFPGFSGKVGPSLTLKTHKIVLKNVSSFPRLLHDEATGLIAIMRGDQVPEEARFWSEDDLEAFFNSNGSLH